MNIENDLNKQKNKQKKNNEKKINIHYLQDVTENIRHFVVAFYRLLGLYLLINHLLYRRFRNRNEEKRKPKQKWEKACNLMN